VSDMILNEISYKLDSLIHLIAYSLIKEMSQKDQIVLLANAGFKPKHIADMIGTTPNTVSVALSALRKKGLIREVK